MRSRTTPASIKDKSTSTHVLAKDTSPPTAAALVKAARGLARLAALAKSLPGPAGTLATALCSVLMMMLAEYELAVAAGTPLRIVPLTKVEVALPPVATSPSGQDIPRLPGLQAGASLRGTFAEALDWIEGARDRMDDLIFNATDAASDSPCLTQEGSLQSTHQHGIEGLRMLRYAAQEVRQAQAHLAVTTHTAPGLTVPGEGNDTEDTLVASIRALYERWGAAKTANDDDLTGPENPRLFAVGSLLDVAIRIFNNGPPGTGAGGDELLDAAVAFDAAATRALLPPEKRDPKPIVLTVADVADLRTQLADLALAGQDAVAPVGQRRLGRATAREQIEAAHRKANQILDCALGVVEARAKGAREEVSHAAA